MEAKLIKSDVQYRLHNEEGIVIATSTDGKLSIKNCQTIERDYDLDELAKEKYPYEKTEMFSCFELDCKQEGFIEGAKTILEILGDKKFSEEDMNKAFRLGHSLQTDINLKKKEYKPSGHFFEELIQSLQQTEWDVEIVTTKRMENGKSGLDVPIIKPKLDADGCLILKKI